MPDIAASAEHGKGSDAFASLPSFTHSPEMGSGAAHQAGHQRDDQEGKEQEEQNLRDTC